MMTELSEDLVLYSATTFWHRLLGLYRLPRLVWHSGLHIAPCRAVHTAGLRYAIDVVFLDAQHKPIRSVHCLRPWRMAYCRAARSVVEFPAGYLAARATPDGAFAGQLADALSVAA